MRESYLIGIYTSKNNDISVENLKKQQIEIFKSLTEDFPFLCCVEYNEKTNFDIIIEFDVEFSNKNAIQIEYLKNDRNSRSLIGILRNKMPKDLDYVFYETDAVSINNFKNSLFIRYRFFVKETELETIKNKTKLLFNPCVLLLNKYAKEYIFIE